MTASLPVPNDIDPEEPDRHSGAPVVRLPKPPDAPAESGRPAAKPRKGQSKGKPRRPAAPRSTQTPARVDTPADPGPPPPLPSDLEVLASAAADLVVPPRPPLPPAAAAQTTVQAKPESAGNAVLDPEPVRVPEPEPVSQPDPVSGPEDVAEPEPFSQPDPVSGPEDVAEPEPVSQPEPVSGPEDVAEPEPVSQPEPVSGPEDVREPERVSEPEELEEPEPAPEPQLVPELGPDPEPAFVSKVDLTPLPGPATELQAQAATEIAPGQTLAPEHAGEADVERQPVAAPGGTPALAPPAVLPASVPTASGDVLVLRGVTKRFGSTPAVEGIDLTVPAGTFYGLVGPNGAGKTTTLSMIAGLLNPDRGTIRIGGVDASAKPLAAKKLLGVLPDRLRTFDRLTGRQLLYYYGVLRGLPPAVVESRTRDLARAFDLETALGRSVSDYSAGMLKKVMLAGALIHSPRLLVLDEPFEAVDPVSSAIILDILSTYVAHGGTVILSSHGMELVERVCTRVAVLVAGQVLAEGTVDEVRGELTLEQRFVELAGGLSDVEGLEWLHTFSD